MSMEIDGREYHGPLLFPELCKCAYYYGQRIVQPHCSLHGTVAAALSDSKEEE